MSAATLAYSCSAADFHRKTVEVFNTTLGLRAWTSVCTGTYVTKPAGTRGIVNSVNSSFCDGYERWQIRWSGDSADRWSAEDWLRVIPADLTISGSVSASPDPIQPGEKLEVSCNIRNVGQGNAPASVTLITVHPTENPGFLTAYEFVETHEVAPSSTISFSFYIPLPPNLAAGDYVVQVRVDSLAEVGQENYDNDVKFSGSFSVGPSQHTITATAGAGGSILPSGQIAVDDGDDVVFTATPDPGYAIAMWHLNEELFDMADATFTLENVHESGEISVFFRPAQFRLEIGGNLADVQVFVDGERVGTTSTYDLNHGTIITVRQYLQSPFQFVDHWSLQNINGIQLSSGTALTTPMLSDTFLQAIIGTRNSSPNTGGRIEEGMPVIVVPPAGTPNIEATRHVQYSHDLVCWHDYALDPTEPQIVISGSPCSFGTLGRDTAFFRTLFDVKVHAEPVLLFPIPGRSATNVRVTSLLDHCNEDPLTAFPADSSPNSSWYLNGLVPGNYHKDKMFMTYKGEVLCEQNSLVQTVPGFVNLWQFTKHTPLSRTLDFNWQYNDNDSIAYSGHPGYDFGVSDFIDSEGQPVENIVVAACAKGTVVPHLSGSFENRIFIEHEALGLATAYLHMKKWSHRMFDYNDTDEASQMFYHAKATTVEPGEILGLVGGAGNKDGKMHLAAFPRHLHVELYRIKMQDGVKYYVLMDPYGAYTELGEQKYGSSWLPSATETIAYHESDYRP